MNGSTAVDMAHRQRAFDVFPVHKNAPKVKNENNSQKIQLKNTQPKPQTATLPKPLVQNHNPTSKKKHFKINKKQLIVNSFIAAFITLGELVPSLQVRPYLVVLAYIWAVIVFKIESKVTFTLALILLAAVPILSFANRQGMAEIYAILAYLILVVGVVSAAIELRSKRDDKIVDGYRIPHS